MNDTVNLFSTFQHIISALCLELIAYHIWINRHTSDTYEHCICIYFVTVINSSWHCFTNIERFSLFSFFLVWSLPREIRMFMRYKKKKTHLRLNESSYHSVYSFLRVLHCFKFYIVAISLAFYTHDIICYRLLKQLVVK